MRKKIFMAGGGGMLGEAFYYCFQKDYDLRITDIECNADWIGWLDFRDFEVYRHQVLSFQPDYLFHLGAHTNLEYCEINREDAYQTNTTAVGHAIAISKELDIPLLYISTAGIFDGKKEEYDEKDEPNPIGQYARTKWLGEKMVLEQKPDGLVCRAGWMMGGGPVRDKKFVGKLLRQIQGGRSNLDIVDDKFGTPTYTHDFAATVKKLIETGETGLFNVACQGVTDRVEIALETIRVLGREKEITVNSVRSDFFKDEYFAPRPDSERLINKRLEQKGQNTMRDWKTCLREYIERDFPGLLVQKSQFNLAR